MARTGTYTFEDLLANRFQSPRAFGLDNILPVLTAELAAHNAVVTSMMAELAEPTTEAQEVYGSAVGGDMLEVDEFADAPTQKVNPGSTVGYPLRKFQHNLGWTEEFMLKGTVADMAINPNNQVIAKFGRAFAKDAPTVTAYDQAFIDAHHAAGVVTALKHFPGHGSSTADSHEGFVDITNTWSPTELDPYRALIAAGDVDMVMVGHLYHADYSDAGFGRQRHG